MPLAVLVIVRLPIPFFFSPDLASTQSDLGVCQFQKASHRLLARRDLKASIGFRLLLPPCAGQLQSILNHRAMPSFADGQASRRAGVIQAVPAGSPSILPAGTADARRLLGHLATVNAARHFYPSPGRCGGVRRQGRLQVSSGPAESAAWGRPTPSAALQGAPLHPVSAGAPGGHSRGAPARSPPSSTALPATGSS